MRKQNFIYGAVCVMAAAGTLCLAPGILNGMGKGEKQISSKTVQTADALTSEPGNRWRRRWPIPMKALE